MSRNIKSSIAGMAILGLLCSCTNTKTDSTMHSVRQIAPSPNDAIATEHFYGTVNDKDEINVSFKVPGQIEKVFVKDGDFVKEGQLIASLDKADYQLGLEAAQTQYEQLENEIKRLELLYKSKSVSENDYEKAISGLKQAKVQYQTYKNKIDYTELYSPISGYIQHFNYEPSEMVDAGMTVANIISAGNRQIEINIPIATYMKRDKFKSFLAKTLSTEESIPLRLISITPKADNNQLYRMILAFDGNIPASITPGMNCEVQINIANDNPANEYTVPMRSVFEFEGKEYVWTISQDSIVTKREVSMTGMDDKGNAIISAGLDGNEMIVDAGVDMLQENEKVRILPEISDTNIGGLL